MTSMSNKPKAATFAINAKHPHIEYFSMEEAQSICKKDFHYMCAQTTLIVNNTKVDLGLKEDEDFSLEKYLECNTPSVYVSGNVWLALMDAWSKRAVHEMHEFMREHGFIEAIAQSSKLADAILSRQESAVISNTIYPVWADVLQQVTVADAEENLYSAQALQSVLEVLRFPKRYSPAKQTDVLLMGLDDFIEFNSSRKYSRKFSMVPQSPLYYGDNYFITEVMDVVQELISGTVLDHLYWMDDPDPEDVEAWARLGIQLVLINLQIPDQPIIEDFTQRIIDAVWGVTSDDCVSELVFDAATTAGATAEFSGENVTKLNKLHQLSHFAPWYKDPGHPWSTHWFPKEELYKSAVVKAVPKSYKTPRIIAKEPVVRNYITTALRKAAVRQVGRKPIKGPFTGHIVKEPWKLFCVDDQNPNRELAWEASFGKLLKLMATIDHSHASDSIAEQLGLTLFPIFRCAPWLRSSGYDVGDAHIHAHIFLSSGHPLTFLCETIVFWAIAFVVTDYVRWHLSKRRTGLPSIKINDPRDFGDDLHLDTHVVELYIQVAQEFGLTINVEKSFYDPDYPYRESCGVEYLYGTPMHGVKWPRTTFDWSEDSDKRANYIKSLVDLQHHVYHNWRAQEIVRCFVLDVEPRMTHSPAFTQCDDLWSDVNRVELGVAPTGKIKDGKLIRLDPEECARIPQEWTAREYHSIPQTYYVEDQRKGLPGWFIEREMNLEIAMYEDFLCNGPQYEDKLMELLGVSSPVSRAALIKRPKLRWVRVRR